MAVAASVIIASARGTLIDAAKVTWPDSELLGYLDEALQKSLVVKPDLCVQFTGYNLNAGHIEQAFPSNTTQLLDITKNTNSGKAVTQVDRALLEAANPGWAAMTPVVDIEHYCVDPRSPRTFLVYPPPASGANVTILVSVWPGYLADIDADIPFSDVYQPVLVDYVLARAYQKNSKKQDLTKASFHLQQWASALGMEAQTQTADTPKITDGTPT